jgi:hypothetical protein
VIVFWRIGGISRAMDAREDRSPAHGIAPNATTE